MRTLSDANGILIKEIAYDSFGNTTGDTLPQFFFPLGFAGGLVDPHTGFIRFGFRFQGGSITPPLSRFCGASLTQTVFYGTG